MKKPKKTAPNDSAALRKTPEPTPSPTPSVAAEQNTHRTRVISLLVLCLFAFFWRLGNVSLFDLDEALYVTSARQMAVSGDMVTPRLNSRPLTAPTQTTVPFFEKPIMVYWASALSMRAFGLNELAARLPVAFAALAATWAIVLMGTRWFGSRAGLLAGLVYATAPMTVLDARQMTTDGLLVLWFTAALFAFWRCSRSATTKENSLPFALLFWLMCAFAILTKGIVGLLLPVLVIGIFLLFRWPLRKPRLADWWPAVKALHPLPGVALLIAVALPWHLLIWKAGGIDGQQRTWVQEYIIRQHVGRFRGMDKVHNAPPPSYFAYFLLGFFPWACFTPAAFRLGAPETETDAPPPSEANEAHRFLLVWFWTIFVFFSAGAAKLPTYIVPAYPAAALLVGRWLDRALTGQAGAQAGRSLRRGALAATLVGALLLTAAFAAPRLSHSAQVPPVIFALVLTITGLLTVGSAAAFLFFRREGQESIWRGIGALAFMMLAVIWVGCSFGYAVAQQYILAPYQHIAIEAREDAEAGIPVVFYHIIPRRPSMLFYAGYSPLERKETPLLPFVRTLLSAKQPEADVITSYDSFTKELAPEVAQSRDASIRSMLTKGSGANRWMLIRLAFQPPSQ